MTNEPYGYLMSDSDDEELFVPVNPFKSRKNRQPATGRTQIGTGPRGGSRSGDGNPTLPAERHALPIIITDGNSRSRQPGERHQRPHSSISHNQDLSPARDPIGAFPHSPSSLRPPISAHMLTSPGFSPASLVYTPTSPPLRQDNDPGDNFPHSPITAEPRYSVISNDENTLPLNEDDLEETVNSTPSLRHGATRLRKNRLHRVLFKTKRKIKRPLQIAYRFFTEDVVPNIYLHILLRIPSLYYSRVARAFQDARLSMPDIEAMYHVSDQDFARLEWSIDPKNQQASNSPPPVLYTFKSSWSDFIDSLVSEWQFQNVVSAVLLSAVLTMLQIGSVEADILCRTMAIVSLICSLMSILYCCVFIARFGLMKKLHRAASWAEETRKLQTAILWNAWVFLAMPTIWLAWAIIAFFICILSFVWRATPMQMDPVTHSERQVLVSRIAISSIFGVGLLHLALILKTLANYGTSMEEKWIQRREKEKQYMRVVAGQLPVHPRRPHMPIETYRRDPRSQHPVRNEQENGGLELRLPAAASTTLRSEPIRSNSPEHPSVPQKARRMPVRSSSLFNPLPYRTTEKPSTQDASATDTQELVSEDPQLPQQGSHSHIVVVAFDKQKVADLGDNALEVIVLESEIETTTDIRLVPALEKRNVEIQEWTRFIKELASSMDRGPSPQDTEELLSKWNTGYFGTLGIKASIIMAPPQGKAATMRDLVLMLQVEPMLAPGPYLASLRWHLTEQSDDMSPAAFKNIVAPEPATGVIQDDFECVVDGFSHDFTLPSGLEKFSITLEDWSEFKSTFFAALQYGMMPIPNLTIPNTMPPELGDDEMMAIRDATIADVLNTWNARYFVQRRLHVQCLLGGTEIRISTL